MRYCIAVKKERVAMHITAKELAMGIGTDVYVGNPVRVWVTSKLSLETIRSLPWVEDAILSVDND